MSKKQLAYDQLMKLTMTSWDIDNYIANFEHLALKAGWALPAEGTIDQFRNGLNKMIHSKVLDRDMIPCTMDEWKAATRTEVARAKEKYNAGLLNSQHRNNPQPRSHDFGNPHTSPTQPCSNTTSSNSGIILMDINAANATPFKRLMPKERAQLVKEGRCFRCQLQGHMACKCPKNKTPQSFLSSYYHHLLSMALHSHSMSLRPCSPSPIISDFEVDIGPDKPPEPPHSPVDTVMANTPAKKPKGQVKPSTALPGGVELSVFDILNIFCRHWFLSRSHLVTNVISAQKAEDRNISWVESPPPFHAHLVKCALVLVPRSVPIGKAKG